MTCIIVLGTHRSGTSATARVLSGLGVRMGTADLGVHEDPTIRDIDEKLLDGGWTSTKGLIASEPTRLDLCRRFHAHCDRRSADPLWGFKDPRFCQTAALLVPHLPAQVTDVHYVVVHRPLRAVLASLETRDGRTRDQNRAITTAHLDARDAFLRSALSPQFHLQYDDLIDDPAWTVGRLAAFLALPVTADALDAIKPDQRHHT